jgi:hypothetical protein
LRSEKTAASAHFEGEIAMSLSRVRLGVLVASVLAGCGSSASSGTQSQENLTKPGDGGPISYAEQAVVVYGDAALASGETVSCSSANGGAAAIVFEQVSTGVTTTIAGAAALGQVSIVGGDGTSRAGKGDVVLGFAGQWNAAAQQLEAGGALGGYYSVATGAPMPADEASAEALFDAAMGAGARHGLALSQTRNAGDLRGGGVAAFYNTGTQTITIDGLPVTMAIAVGIVKNEGGATAVQITGAGAFASYVR